MGKKKDGITDLTRVLVTAAEKFSNAEDMETVNKVQQEENEEEYRMI